MKIVLSISGGIVRCAYYNSDNTPGEVTPGEVPDIVVMDHDVEGTRAEDLARIPEEGRFDRGVMMPGDGQEFVDVYTVDAIETDGGFFDKMYHAERSAWVSEQE